jgi:prepilin-type N-terminal cleavage/methylation domain-containing protein
MCRQPFARLDEGCHSSDTTCHLGSVDRQHQLPTGSKHPGFTIIEMACVLLVIAITAAFAIPLCLNYIRMYNLGVAAQNVSTALQRARYLATLNNGTAAIHILDSGAQINILQFSAASGGQAQPAGVVTLPSDIMISSGSPREIDFDGRGTITPLPAQSPVIEIDGAFGYYSNVTVSPTGQVTISPAMPKSTS